MGNYAIAYTFPPDGWKGCSGVNTVIGAPSQEEAVSAFTTVMKWAHITVVKEVFTARNFSCPVEYRKLQRDIESRQRIKAYFEHDTPTIAL